MDSRMVKDAVQYNADFLCMALPDQLPKLFVRPKNRIDAKIIRGRIFVVKIPLKNRGEIQAFNAQLFRARLR